MRRVIEVTSEAGTTIAVTVGEFATPESAERWARLTSDEQQELRLKIAAAREED